MSAKPKSIPYELVGMLRQRRGLEETDSSQDEAIAAMTPANMVRECAGWRMGDRGWADTFAYWMRAAKAKPEDFQ